MKTLKKGKRKIEKADKGISMEGHKREAELDIEFKKNNYLLTAIFVTGKKIGTKERLCEGRCKTIVIDKNYDYSLERIEDVSYRDGSASFDDDDIAAVMLANKKFCRLLEEHARSTFNRWDFDVINGENEKSSPAEKKLFLCSACEKKREKISAILLEHEGRKLKSLGVGSRKIKEYAYC